MLNNFKKASPLMQVTVIVIVLVLIVLALKFFRSFLENSKIKSESLGEELALEAQGVQQSYSTAKYKQFANKLYVAFDGMGTDENAVYSVFGQMNNDLDIIKLNTAFGIKEETDLTGWILSELSSSELMKLNNILANKGINHQY